MSDDYPQYTGTQLSMICQMLPRPQLLTGLFVEHLQRHFSQADFREDPTLRELIWEDSDATPILIESAWRWDPTTTGLRPAVIVKRNGYKSQRLGVGDNRYQLPPSDKRGDPHFWLLWLGSHTLFCTGGSGAQVEMLASEVQREFTQFGPELRESLGLMRFEVLETGPISILEEAQDNFVVPIIVAYAYPEAWSLRRQAPRLKTISLTTVLEF